MPRYNYVCKDCRARAEVVKGEPLTDEELPEVMFETSHAMNPTVTELHEARECPRCNGHDTDKSYVGVELTCYVRGYGYLDRAGATRDMNLHKLQHDDPYAAMRSPGEAEDLKLRLQRAGKHQPNPKHYVGGPSQGEMERAVNSAVNSG